MQVVGLVVIPANEWLLSLCSRRSVLDFEPATARATLEFMGAMLPVLCDRVPPERMLPHSLVHVIGELRCGRSGCVDRVRCCCCRH